MKNGSYSSVMIVVFVAIIIVINMIVGNLPSKYTQLDISSEKLYTIGDETKSDAERSGQGCNHISDRPERK